MKTTIKSSELILRDDGSIYHLGLKPDEITTKIIVVGDPSRVELISSFFDEILLSRQNREFHSVLGIYKNKKILAISSGISSDNVDILISELDALANIDFDTRQVKETLTKLTIVRIGTCGGVSDNVDLGDFVLSRYAIGGELLLNYYNDSPSICVSEAQEQFVKYVGWNKSLLGTPYCVEASMSLVKEMKEGSKEGITYCAGGFYAPQGRMLRLSSSIGDFPSKVEGFSYNGVPLLNIEMEGAAVVGLARLLGHEALTMCVIVAHRKKKSVNINYGERVSQLIKHVLDKI
ncbi:MAG: nucleoside phosphorylase [Rikenellaceae bacterium]